MCRVIRKIIRKIKVQLLIWKLQVQREHFYWAMIDRCAEYGECERCPSREADWTCHSSKLLDRLDDQIHTLKTE